MKDLTGKQKRYLRGLGNQIKSTVFVGNKGVTETIVEAINESFQTSELVKIKLQEGYQEDRKEAGKILAESADASLVQVMGKTILLYRENTENPEISLPA